MAWKKTMKKRRNSHLRISRVRWLRAWARSDPLREIFREF
jgi:hypothetical protein